MKSEIGCNVRERGTATKSFVVGDAYVRSRHPVTVHGEYVREISGTRERRTWNFSNFWFRNGGCVDIRESDYKLYKQHGPCRLVETMNILSC